VNAKKIVTTALLVFVAASISYMIARENCICSVPRQVAPPAAMQPQAVPLSDIKQAEPNQQLIVYYFHGDVRCPTCHKLEGYAKEALDTYFADDLAAGKIQWKPTNIDRPGNEHFVKDYSLVTKSVVVSRVLDGNEVSWKNLDQIWQKVGDKNSYLEYIQDSIIKFLGNER
jgi:hypothetical protein